MPSPRINLRKPSDGLNTAFAFCAKNFSDGVPFASCRSMPRSPTLRVTPSASLPIVSALPLRLMPSPSDQAPLTEIRPGGASGINVSTAPLPLRSIAIDVPPIGCERLNASCSDAFSDAGGELSNASVAFSPPGTARVSVGLPAKVGMTAVRKPAAGSAGGSVNERSRMLPRTTASTPNAACTFAASAGAAPSRAASLSASCVGVGAASASPVRTSSILPSENALG